MQHQQTNGQQRVTRARILTAFAAKALSEGPSSVSLVCLAKDLDIQLKSFYLIFPTKAEMLTALIKQWSEDWRQEQERGLIEGLAPGDRTERYVIAWYNLRTSHGPIFWQQLKNDFPDVYKMYLIEHDTFLRRAAVNIQSTLRPGLNALLALNNLMALIKNCADYAVCERVGVKPEQAMQQALALWRQGALK